MHVKTGNPQQAPKCPKCGKPMRYRDTPDGKPQDICDACKTSQEAAK